MYSGIIERYHEYLPISATTPIVSLSEGRTPLIAARKLAREIDPRITLYLKYEGINPTGSFKDRGMTLAVSKAVEEGMRTVICASTGNTSASAAAYAARAGLLCHVLIPCGNIALGKLAQALVHSAKVLAIEGNFDDALNLVRDIAATHPIALVNSVNPYRLQGQQTAAFEVVDDLGDAPHIHVLPVGNAGNITAYWMGYKAYRSRGNCTKLPRMLGFQAAGAAPLVHGNVVPFPETVATAIRIGNPASWNAAIAARDESNGLIDSVTDAEIMEAYHMIASLEGIFAEPASGAPIAGLRKLARQGFFTEPVTVVATLTGHGLKDPNIAVSEAVQAPMTVPAKCDPVLKSLGY